MREPDAPIVPVPVARAVLTPRTRAALLCLRVLALALAAMVVYTFVANVAAGP
ncbi:hypothetical protein [Sinomonas sp. ASV322]|uniref:hypothetical protein n=1 Tax=Sinomonas sp. ASV322 TaxID=3041920 RepID=UPI0027DB19B0|nr:hypothetical protein [Sinomonas sp. ASV322]MDQ4502411.1 hypothetical protein [Sinomonas sp. ASV322]